MNVMEDLLEMDWDGPLSSVADLPTALLYGAVLTFTVTKGPAVVAAVRAALEPLLGTPEERKTLLGGKRLEFSGKIPAEAVVKGSTATLRFGARVKGKRVEEIVDGLAAVPDARDLRLTAAVRRFGQEPLEAPIQ